MNSEEVQKQIENLTHHLKIIEDSYQFHTNWLLGILGFVVAASGASLFILARFWFNSSVSKSIKDMKQNITREMKAEVKNELENKYRSYTFTVAAGSMFEIPYEPLEKGVHPTVFVRTHDLGDLCKITIDKENKSIRVENKNESLKDLPIDLLIMKANVKL